MNHFVVDLASERATLELVGGKGANLSALMLAGFRVPPCAALSTKAYDFFVETNGLQPLIERALVAVRPNDPDTLARASRTIREGFVAGRLPDDIEMALQTAVALLGKRRPSPEMPDTVNAITALAVRSSATAEDLPDLSFAGQQETFLNVNGRQALRKAVVDCWSSLWTARAIGYRQRNEIPHEGVALAVLIQEMIPSESSGVLFTANPLTGRRSEMVVDATLGLGEALVSGQVEPDHYVVDSVEGAIIEKRLGAKDLAIRDRDSGGDQQVQVTAAERPAIADEDVLRLVSQGGRVAELFGTPQDIEWSLCGGVLYLLQSRPITSLYPLPEGFPAMDEALRVLFSFGAVQGILDPMTPLGREAIRGLFAGGGRLLSYRFTPQSQRAILEAGERLFVDITPPLRHTVGRRLVGGSMKLIEPGAAEALDGLWDDSRLAPSSRMRFRTFWRLLRFLAPTAARLVFTMIWPEDQRERVGKQEDRLLTRFEECFADANSLGRRLDCFERLLDEAFPSIFPGFLPTIAGGMASLNAIKQISKRMKIDESQALMVARGMPHNVTTEMDLALWSTASIIKKNPESADYFGRADVAELSAAYLQGRLPETGQKAVGSFMQRYGMRGTAEIDLGRARWREEPSPVMRSLQSYLGIEDPELAPDSVFERGAVSALEAESRLADAARGTRFGRSKAWLVHFFCSRMRALAGLRESPKFLIMRLMGMARESLLVSGQALVDQGIFAEADDIFFLTLAELREIGSGEPPSGTGAEAWRNLVVERRGDYGREERRRQIPRLLLSDGRSFYEGMGVSGAVDESSLVGSPVSPGVVEGAVRVVFDPAEAGLRQGEILVCPGTDPSWTPLFLLAGGLVTEVGGLMTHGSVVAREYGIPAVVGVHEATKRLRTGQRVRLDGATGIIVNCEL